MGLTFGPPRAIDVCAKKGTRCEGSLSLAGKVDPRGLHATAHSMHAKIHPQPWIHRVVESPLIRSGYVSLVVHVILCLVLAILALETKSNPRPMPLVITMGTVDAAAAGEQVNETTQLSELVDIARPQAARASDDGSIVASDLVAVVLPEAFPPVASSIDTPVVQVPLAPVVPPDLTILTARGPTAQPISTKFGSAEPRSLPPPRPSQPASAPGRQSENGIGTHFAARRGAARGQAATSRGGSASSEAAVERGLAWLSLHQAVDGSWQFDLSGCRCDGACRDPGTIESSTASTAIALLPFLGAGSTQVDGPYQQTVARGIYYLTSRMQSTPRGGDFCEGTMYGHGVTTLVLAEAFGMTKDDMLEAYCRDAVRFIQTSQDMHGGGWRYLPGQAGDLTVTAWQLAALKSAAMAGLATPSPTMEGVCRFLDRVQTQNGAAYGYRSPAAKPCTSAIGLLCRMYTGWGEEEEALQRGITNLAKPGPSPSAIYQNFYLSQALLQSAHPVWPRWNAKNRDQILAQQTRFGHETGSWFFADADTAPGGRLAHTALAVLTLEVYYRLLPIYQQAAVEK